MSTIAKRHYDTRERQSKFPLDDRLRAWGFRIASRPCKGDTLWIDEDRQVWTQSAALRVIEEWKREGAVV